MRQRVKWVPRCRGTLRAHAGRIRPPHEQRRRTSLERASGRPPLRACSATSPPWVFKSQTARASVTTLPPNEPRPLLRARQRTPAPRTRKRPSARRAHGSAPARVPPACVSPRASPDVCPHVTSPTKTVCSPALSPTPGHGSEDTAEEDEELGEVAVDAAVDLSWRGGVMRNCGRS